MINTFLPGSASTQRNWLAKWRPEPIPRSEWIEYPESAKHSSIQIDGRLLKGSPIGPFIYFFQDSHLMAIRLDPKQRRVSEPFQVRFAGGSAVEIRPDDNWSVRGSGIVVERVQVNGRPWLLHLLELIGSCHILAVEGRS